MTTTLQELEMLSVPEWVQIVEDLWDSIARSNANLPILQLQKDELAQRKERYLQNPDSGETWDQVKMSIPIIEYVTQAGPVASTKMSPRLHYSSVALSLLTKILLGLFRIDRQVPRGRIPG
jgi:putative addiction module component (TIGR02574 family)